MCRPALGGLSLQRLEGSQLFLSLYVCVFSVCFSLTLFIISNDPEPPPKPAPATCYIIVLHYRVLYFCQKFRVLCVHPSSSCRGLGGPLGPENLRTPLKGPLAPSLSSLQVFFLFSSSFHQVGLVTIFPTKEMLEQPEKDFILSSRSSHSIRHLKIRNHSCTYDFIGQ